MIVQTFVPDHYAVRPVRDHDYETFYAQELAHRRALGFPPLGHLASVLVSAEREADAVAGAAQLAAAIAAAGACELLGPAPAPLPRLRGRHRHQLLIKGGRDAVQSAARAALAAAARLRDGVTAAVDVRPWSML